MMAIRNGEIRDFLREHVEAESLERFEDLCDDVDEIKDELDAEKDPKQAWDLAVEWATTITALAELELALLSNILEQFMIDEEPIRAKIAELQAAKDRSWQEYQRVGGVAGLPFSEVEEQGEKIRTEHAKALVRNREFADQIRLESAKLKTSVNLGGIARDIRSLRQFVRTRFPQPVKKTMNPMKPVVEDLSRSPFQAFADRFVANMDSEKTSAEKAMRARAIKADARPARDWDAEKKAHVEKVRARAQAEA